MKCLHCGDCCLRMSPLTGGECPNVVSTEDYYFCSVYENRPKQCADHDFPARVCPIGLSKLNINSSDVESIGNRLKEGCMLSLQI